MIIVASVFFACYLLLLVVLFIGWQAEQEMPLQTAEQSFSVIVPVRNEENNIPSLLESLLKQNYHNYQIIIVDDHSADSTVSVITQFSGNQRMKFTRNAGQGKKQAITTGISMAEGEIIIATDGDCFHHPDWLGSMNKVFSSRVKMAIGPVRLQGKGLFADMQKIEFASLIGTTRSMVQLGIPIMCNGANLAYRKTVFEEVDGYTGNDHIASGDDEFLMRKILDRYPDSIVFVNTLKAVVSTPAMVSLRSFFQQRVRWASKWKLNKSFAAFGIALFLAMFQIVVIKSYFEAILGNPTYLILLVTKASVEAILLVVFCRFLQTRWNWLAFFLLQIVYPWYVLVTGVLSLRSAYSWKGRSYR